MDSIDICEISAGAYPMGDNAITVSRPAHNVSLAAFAIGKTEVTHAQFAAFVEAGSYQDERVWSEMGWRWHESKRDYLPAFWDDRQFNAPDQPVVGVSWYEADAFA